MQNNVMNGRRSFWTDMSQRANKALQTGEYLASEGLNGLFLGNWDELEGIMGGIGYAFGSLNPNWNTRDESISEAFRRGYNKTRDNRRQVIDEGYQEHPIAGTAMRTIGTAVSPANTWFSVSKTAPLSYKAAANARNAVAMGVVGGYGDSQTNNTSEIAYNMGNKVTQNIAGNNLLGGIDNPLVRNTISTLAGNGVGAFENYSRNKFNY